MNKFTMLVTAAEVANERREGETMMQTKERLQQEAKSKYLRQPWMPDFDAVRDKRMSELTDVQKLDAHELWLREQMAWMPPYYQEHLLFLLERLDAVRKAAHGKESAQVAHDETQYLLSTSANAKRLMESVAEFRAGLTQVQRSRLQLEATALSRSTNPADRDAAAGLTGLLAATPAPRDWHEYQRIADLPMVHDALHDFSQDPTGDNGVIVVQAVLETVSKERT